MNKYRSHYDIVFSMLQRCTGGPVNKTKLMYECYVSYDQLKRILTQLKEARLLEPVVIEEGKEPLFRTTEKGLKFLKLYPPVKDLVEPEPEPEPAKIKTKDREKKVEDEILI